MGHLLLWIWKLRPQEGTDLPKVTNQVLSCFKHFCQCLNIFCPQSAILIQHLIYDMGGVR